MIWGQRWLGYFWWLFALFQRFKRCFPNEHHVNEKNNIDFHSLRNRLEKPTRCNVHILYILVLCFCRCWTAYKMSHLWSWIYIHWAAMRGYINHKPGMWHYRYIPCLAAFIIWHSCWAYPMKTKLDIYVFITITGGIIRPVVSVSTLTWFIRYMHYWNLFPK